jgi:CRISPR/Cas system-associated exonuclease Cas4 (RecB family)
MEAHMIRVTELLRWAGVTSPIPDTPAVQAALVRGTAVHEHSVQIEPHVVDGTDRQFIATLPESLRGYGHAVAQFTKQFSPVWDEVEVRKDDAVIGLTGCPDRVGMMSGERVIIDYKTGGMAKWHRLQLALYAILVERCGVNGRTDYRIDKRMNVYLAADGSYRLDSHRTQQDILDAWKIITRYKEATHEN